jgi:predicted TPR repeat methyltransferase
MEVLYYLDDIPAYLESVRQNWLRKDGIFAFGIDHYQENQECHGWSDKVGVRMSMFSESEWRDMVEKAGFEILRMFRAASSEEWAGTLAIVARNKD